MKDAIYFQHDYNAHNDEKIIKLRMKYGWAGYGVFWALIEIMRESTDVVLSLSELDAFAFRLHCDINLSHFVEDCVTWNLFKKDGNVFYSNRLHKDVSAMKEKSRKAKDAANLRWNKERDANALPMQSYGSAGAMQGEDSIEEESIEDKYAISVSLVVSRLNGACGTAYRVATKSTASHIRARLKEGFSVEDLTSVINHQNKLWGKDQKMSKYLRPSTLFNSEKFESYLNDAKKSNPVEVEKKQLSHREIWYGSEG